MQVCSAVWAKVESFTLLGKNLSHAGWSNLIKFICTLHVFIVSPFPKQMKIRRKEYMRS